MGLSCIGRRLFSYSFRTHFLSVAGISTRKMDVARMKELRKNISGEYAFGGPMRQPVPMELCQWGTLWKDYKPEDFTSLRVLGKPYADPELGTVGFAPKWNEEDGPVHRVSWEGKYEVEVHGRPLNPVGRTGIKGRGVLGRWGPNHAADSIVTRWKRNENGEVVMLDDKPVLQFIAITRLDTGDLALPGGMVEPGEDFVEAAKREFLEEVYSLEELDSEGVEGLKRATGDVLVSPDVVYKGYVDDRRNTDNAWIETFAVNFHIEDKEKAFNHVKFKAGSDATGASWNDCRPMVMYASHIQLIQTVAERLGAAWSS